MTQLPIRTYSRKLDTYGFVGTIVLVCLAVLMIWLYNERFFFMDDTENGAYGIWYKLGNAVLDHKWLVFSSSGWMAGNYTAEGQWGTWSPLFMLIGVLCVKMDDAFVFTALLKGFFMCLGATGLYRVSRSYGGSPIWSMFAGVACSIAGFTLFRDVTSWVTNLMIWAILPWVWWATRRLMYEGKSPLAPFAFGYCLVTTGYVQGTIMLIVMYLALLVENLLTANTVGWRLWKNTPVVKMVINGALLGLVAFTVYYPGTQVAEISNRKYSIENSGLLANSVTNLFNASIPTQLPPVGTWKSTLSDLPLSYSPLPYDYIAWFVPLIFLANFQAVKMYWKEISGLLFFTVFTFFYTIGPSDLGPLRFPIRMIPFFCFGALALFAILMSRAKPVVTRTRVLLMLGYFAFSWYVTWAQTPQEWKFHDTLNIVVLIGLLACAYLLKKQGDEPLDVKSAAPLGTVLALVTAIVLGSQLSYFNMKFVSGFINLQAPRYFSDYQKILPEAKNQVFVIGDPRWIPNDAAYQETAVSNNWYITPHKTQNLYSVIEYKPYTIDLCMNAHGFAGVEYANGDPCDFSVKDKLFSIDPGTQMPIIDLLSIDTLQIIKDPKYTQEQFLADNQPPAGWHLAKQYPTSVVWVRDNPMGQSGGVAWTSPGFKVEQVSNDETSVSFKVIDIPENGGGIVFSRLYWPGYEVVGGKDVGTVSSSEEASRHYLLGAGIAGNTKGQVVTIQFHPPKWGLEKASIGAAIAGITLWTIGYYLVRNKKTVSTATSGRRIRKSL